MRLVVASEHRFERTPDGCVWAVAGADYSFWRRYLSAFDEVRLAVRVRDCASVPPTASRVDGPGIEVWGLPNYVGSRQFLSKRSVVRRALHDAAAPGDGVLLRLPSAIGGILARHRERAGLPYVLEVVGDPYDVFSRGAISHPLRAALRQYFSRALRSHCRYASGVAYVTGRTLQARYPASMSAVVAEYSSIELPRSAFVDAARASNERGCPSRLISIGSLEQPYKGIDVLLSAIALLRARGEMVTLTHVGDGRLRRRLEQLAERLGIADGVTFVGAVPGGAPVRDHLRAADLFVLPSRAEGLPRALIEAMALGLPAIGSTAGGTPELLPDCRLVRPGDVSGLAAAIARLIRDPAAMERDSARNLSRAGAYASSVLEMRRANYYESVRAVFESVLSVRANTPDATV
ncbi:glycosyltransferase [Actinoplanes sp. NPDC049548]|uniref:glycosyltransferase n=1 Tax=Actinoplanes sp. NPDC049548 TaxID=3155152 RepID=UPI00341218D3